MTHVLKHTDSCVETKAEHTGLGAGRPIRGYDSLLDLGGVPIKCQAQWNRSRY